MRSTLPPPPRHELDSTATIARSTLPPPPPRPSHKHRRTGWQMFRWFHIVAIIIAIGTSLIFGYGEAGGVVALFIILVPFEKMFRSTISRSGGPDFVPISPMRSWRRCSMWPGWWRA